MNSAPFASLALSPAMLTNLNALEYTVMTPVQAHSLPHILAGRDVIARAKTGSGKTAAFGIGLLSRLDAACLRVQALVLCPTRELADQVCRELRRLARCIDNVKILAVCGGVPIAPQRVSLEHGAHVLVGTPGRLLDHLRRGSLELAGLRTLVLDEADRMLDMGFQEDVDTLIAALPQQRQTLLFSATYPPAISAMSATIQQEPVEVSVDEVHGQGTIRQVLYEVDGDARSEAVARILAHLRPEAALVFCNTRQECQELADFLVGRGITALAIHGEMEQRERDQVLIRFGNRSATVLVATDVAARGLDIKELPVVINYELSRNPETHTHRIGRTGRAGGEGVAISLVTQREARLVSLIEAAGDGAICRADLAELPPAGGRPQVPAMVTLCIDGGRRNKLRPGDILGALTGEAGIDGGEVGRIDICESCSYVAIRRPSSARAQARLGAGRIKGRFFRVRRIG